MKGKKRKEIRTELVKIDNRLGVLYELQRKETITNHTYLAESLALIAQANALNWVLGLEELEIE